jgi:hypothetical protein
VADHHVLGDMKINLEAGRTEGSDAGRYSARG